METFVKIKLSLKEILFLFDKTDLVNIRYYQPVTISPTDDNKVFFDVKVRHNVDEKPRDLIKKALKVLKLRNKLSDLKEKLSVANERENQVLANRGWGYAQRHTKIGFSTTRTDSLKARIDVVKEELETLTK
jgi:hypothetical protein